MRTEPEILADDLQRVADLSRMVARFLIRLDDKAQAAPEVFLALADGLEIARQEVKS